MIPKVVHVDDVIEVGGENKCRQIKCDGGSEKRWIGTNEENFM